MKGTRAVGKSSFGVPFLLLAFEYGLVNSYLYKDNEHEPGMVYLKFNEKVLENLQLTDSSYYSMNERLICCEYFEDVMRKGSYVIYKLRIPEEHIADVHNIISGRYTALSKAYKKELRVKQRLIPKWKNKLGYFIVQKNLAVAIAVKAKFLEREIVEVLDLNYLPQEAEYFAKFSKERESV